MKQMKLIILLIVTSQSYAQYIANRVSSSKQETTLNIANWSAKEHTLSIENPDSYLYDGFQKIQAGAYKEALVDLGKAIEHSKNHHEYIYFYRGLAKHALGDYKHAEIDFTRSLLINSIMADAYFLRALSKFEMGEYERATIDFKKSIQPGKSLLTTSTRKVHEVINDLNNRVSIDTSVVEGLASY